MPHDILAILLKLIETNYRDQDQSKAAEAWILMVMWCVMAAQADKNGDSIVAFAVEAVTENDDPYLGQWMELVLSPPGKENLNQLTNWVGQHVPIKRLTIAYHRNPNLANLNSYQKLSLLTGLKLSTFIVQTP